MAKRWTEAEITFLKEGVKTKTYSKISEELGRSLNSVTIKARKLKCQIKDKKLSRLTDEEEKASSSEESGNGKCGIYAINNLITGQRYIGQSSNIRERWAGHKCELVNGRHRNKHLQASYDKYNHDYFEFEVMEECLKDELDNKEIKYIKLYRTTERRFGFNKDAGGKILNAKRIAELTRRNGRKCSKPVIQIDLDGKVIKRWNSASEAGRELKLDISSISSSAKRLGSVCKNYIWILECDYDENCFNVEAYFRHNNLFTSVVQLDINGNFIEEFTSVKQACNHTNCHPAGISQCLSGKYETSGGFKWIKYEEYYKNSN